MSDSGVLICVEETNRSFLTGFMSLKERLVLVWGSE